MFLFNTEKQTHFCWVKRLKKSVLLNYSLKRAHDLLLIH